ncbi:MAG: hypothetical protein Q9181_006874 [Wetmoreana brouardii]
MQAPYSLLILLHILSLCAAEAVGTAGPAIAKLSAASKSNLSAIPNIPDADFDTVSYYHDNTPISENACVMVFVAAMRQLALRHFEEDLSPGSFSWQHPRYPGVVLSLGPPLGKHKISVRFALWTVNAALRDMMFRDRFQEMEIFTTYKGNPIGFLQMLPSTPTVAVKAEQGPAIMQQPQGDGLAPTASSGSSVTFDVNSTRVGADVGTVRGDQLQAHIDYLDKKVDRRDIWVMIVWSMLYLAPSNRVPLGFWRTSISSVASEVTCIWNSVRPPPRTRPYLLTIGDLISLLAQLAEQLLQDNQFREMNIAAREKGIDIARGSFRTKPLSV